MQDSVEQEMTGDTRSRIRRSISRTQGKTVHYVGHGNVACMRPMPPGTWPPGHVWSHDWDNVTCEECLKGRAPIDTFIIERQADGRTSIMCRRCQLTSFNPNDVEDHYCGKCHAYHDDIWPPARQWWIDHPDLPHP